MSESKQESQEPPHPLLFINQIPLHRQEQEQLLGLHFHAQSAKAAPAMFDRVPCSHSSPCVDLTDRVNLTFPLK